MKPAKSRTEIRRLELELPCRLKDDELIAKGEVIAREHAIVGEARIAKKLQTDEINGTIKSHEAAISVLVGQIRTRSENRQVECAEELVPGDGTVIIRRLDTKQIVRTRTMTDVERQPGLFGPEAVKEEKPKAKRAPKAKALAAVADQA